MAHKLVEVLGNAGRIGMGMFIESYFIFAIGNVHAIWQVQFPSCFGPVPTVTGQSCDGAAVNSLTCKSLSSVSSSRTDSRDQMSKFHRSFVE